MNKIFISYSRTDIDFALKLKAALEATGQDVWMDTADIKGGDRWEKIIREALKASEIMLILVSPKSMASRYVAFEFHYFEPMERLIIPVFCLSTSHDDLFLSIPSLQQIDFVNQPFEAAFEQLATAIGFTIPDEVIPPEVESKSTPKPQTLADFAAAVRAIIGEPFEWCDVPAGEFLFGDRKEILNLPRFAIAKYPITYAQFQTFIDAKDGFKNSQWWQGLAADDEHKAKPGKQTQPIKHYPRENVNWYDAIVFCRWLSYELDGTYDIDTPAEWLVRLPTEPEWEKAARGTDGLNYPWGNKFDKNKCNAEESEIGHTTSVDNYPVGVSPYGVLDMSGNVWEWVLSEWLNTFEHELPSQIKIRDVPDINRISLRGGSWSANQTYVRTVSRAYTSQLDRRPYIGFRICTSILPA